MKKERLQGHAALVVPYEPHFRTGHDPFSSFELLATQLSYFS